MKKLIRKIKSFINWIRFVATLKIDNFGGNSPEAPLIIVRNFIALEAPLYKKTNYLGRTPVKSSELLQALINSYLETKSEVTLSQILEVLKKEFIKRDTYGRK